MASRNDGLFDDAAEESDDQPQEDDEQNASGDGEGEQRVESQAGSDVDSSDEEEGGNEYDMTDKFIAPEDEDEAGDESESDEEGGRRKKRKRRRREEEELDEEDFALLEEQGVRVDVRLSLVGTHLLSCSASAIAPLVCTCRGNVCMLQALCHDWQEATISRNSRKHRAPLRSLPVYSHRYMRSCTVLLQNIRRKQAAQRKRIRQKKDETAARQSNRTAEEQVQHELFGEDADAGACILLRNAD